MRRLAVLAAAAFVALASAGKASAQNFQDIIPLESSLYRWADDLSLIAGMTIPSTVRPWSRAEALKVLRRIARDGDLESAAARRLYAACESGLETTPIVAETDGFAFAAEPSASLEAYALIPVSVTGSADASEFARVVDYRDRLPMADLPLSAWAGDFLAGMVQFTVRDDYRLVDDSWSGASGYSGYESPDDLPAFSLNATSLLNVDTFLPFRAWFAGGNGSFSIQFGRDALSWGNGLTGNLMLSDSADYHDFVRVRVFADAFSFSSVFAAIQSDDDEPDRVPAGFASHRLEWRWKDLGTIAFSESLAIQDADSALGLIHDMNPLLVYHGWLAPERANSLMTAELTVTPWKRVAAYGQFALDETRTGPEAEAGDEKAQATGWLAGVRAAVPLGEGYVRAWVEGALTDPWLYNRYNAPYYRWQRRIWSFVEPQCGFWPVKPIGYFAGPDALVAAGSVGYELPGEWRASFAFTWVGKGEIDLTTDYPTDPGAGLSATTPTGVPENRYEAVLSGEWQAREWLTLSSTFACTAVDSVGHVRGDREFFIELAVGATVSYR
ncbi:MAG: hypothetical protein NT080_09735 [Spirochaetes bacterium]|nr:hypothetical protein [Spirochaetota bacterium]